MRKLFTGILISLFISLNSVAQNPLPNPGFEAWTNAGIYENPNNWNTLNPSTATLGVLTALRATGTDVRSGNNAIKLITKTVLTFTANGIATTGTINSSTQTIQGGIPYTGRPDSISGWYKYTSVGGDNGFVAFVLLDALDDTIGFANFTTPAANVGTYTYFSTAIVYFSTGTPTLSRCLLSSSAGFTAVVNSTMFIDDLQLTFNSTETRENIPTALGSINYSSVSRVISINSLNHSNASIMNLAGKEISKFAITSANFEFNIKNLIPGIYIIHVYDENSKTNMTKKIFID